MEITARFKLIWFILIAILSGCTQSNSPDIGTNNDQAGVLKQEEEVKTTLINMWEAKKKKILNCMPVIFTLISLNLENLILP